MWQYSWNPKVVYRNIHGRHLLIDTARSSYYIEVSPILGTLFDRFRQHCFSEALDQWMQQTPSLSSDHARSALAQVFELLANKGFITHGY